MCVFRSVFGIVGVIISNPVVNVKIRKVQLWNDKWADGSVMRLMGRADYFTPAEIRYKTRVAACTKNGKGLIDNKESNSIARLGYQRPDSNSCKRFTAKREGIYYWYAINVAADKLQSRTLGSISLGQEYLTVTYERYEWRSDEKEKKYHTKVHVPGRKDRVLLYNRSINKAGTMFARLGIFEAQHAKGRYSSVCVRPSVVGTFWFRHETYVVSGKPSAGPDEDRAAKCLELAKTRAESVIGDSPPVSDFRHVGTAALYDKAKDAGFVGGKNNFAGDMIVSQFLWAAKRACSGEAYLDNTWACVDFSYIYALLHKLNLTNDTVITAAERFNGHVVGYELGYAYTQLIVDLTPELTDLLDI